MRKNIKKVAKIGVSVLDLDHENDMELMEVIAKYLFEKKEEFEEIYDKLGTIDNYFGFISFKKREWLWILNDIIQLYPKIDFI